MLKWKLTARNRTQYIDIVEHPEIPVIYLRHKGPYAQDVSLFEALNNRLFSWAAPRGLLRFPETQYFIICHDNPNLTDDDKLRLTICLSVSEDVEVDGEIGKMIVPAGTYAHVKFKVDPMEIGEAWSWAFGCWLPVSGFLPDDRPTYELYPIDGSERDPDEPVDLEICIPVRAV